MNVSSSDDLEVFGGFFLVISAYVGEEEVPVGESSWVTSMFFFSASSDGTCCSISSVLVSGISIEVLRVLNGFIEAVVFGCSPLPFV